jgi:hypothetical protein
MMILPEYKAWWTNGCWQKTALSEAMPQSSALSSVCISTERWKIYAKFLRKHLRENHYFTGCLFTGSSLAGRGD